MVDSPFECGTHRLLIFTVDGVPHEIALWGRGNEDTAQLLADTQLIVETTRAMFGGLPYKRYLALTAHEFLHVWNVKRIRPATLGPFDYRRENYTRQLWTMEGITSYYTELLLLRAGLIDAPRYLELLAAKIARLQSMPGRSIQSLEQSSIGPTRTALIRQSRIILGLTQFRKKHFTVKCRAFGRAELYSSFFHFCALERAKMEGKRKMFHAAAGESASKVRQINALA